MSPSTMAAMINRKIGIDTNDMRTGRERRVGQLYSPPAMRSALLFLVLTVAVAGCGVQRSLTVQSEPPGALVYLNGLEVGRTPVTRDFTWYGVYDVELRK